MSTYNSLSYAAQLVQAGLSREQAEVHAHALQNLYDQEHQQYATKADFVDLSNTVKVQIHQLEIRTERIETKTDQLEVKINQIEAKTNLIELKTNQLEVKMTQIELKVDQVDQRLSAGLLSLKTTIDECKNEFSHFRSDVSVLRTAHKYILWIGGGVATICVSFIGLNISMFMYLTK